MQDDDDIEDDNYLKHINVLWQMKNWRTVKDREFMYHYKFVYDGLLLKLNMYWVRNTEGG